MEVAGGSSGEIVVTGGEMVVTGGETVVAGGETLMTGEETVVAGGSLEEETGCRSSRLYYISQYNYYSNYN